MNPIQSNQIIQDFIKLLAENSRGGQSEELTRLVQYMEEINQQFEALNRELSEIKKQCVRNGEPNNHETHAISDMTHTLMNKAQEVKEKLDSLWEKITECAVTALQNFKDHGTMALDKAVSMMNVKPALEAIQENISGMMEGARRNIEKVEDIGRELRSAGAHLKNAGRAVSGKEVQEVDGGHEGWVQATALFPMRTVQKLLTGMNNSTLAMIGSVEHLEQSAENAREAISKRAAEKPGKRLTPKLSIRKALAKHEKDSAAMSGPTPERKQQEAAR